MRAVAPGDSPRLESRHLSRHPLGEPVVDCAFADVQLPGGLGLAHPLEITVDDCEAESFGQSGDFFVECRQQIIGRGWPTLFHCVFHLPHLPFECAPPGRCDIGLNGNPVCDPVQPAAEGIPTADGVPLFDQDQEGGLEGIFGIMRVAQDSAADAQDHGPVAHDESFK